ncbi:trypsin-like serine protease [Clostridium tarantellae]|uniref:Serine protease n=1 Tax=Clostridium tarantellae TaxID=39493 RepID=A0A6I1MRZ2_9CLOT|nr:trypsin-like serine protease [Clostridium tarantellae]MPQ44967.1 hypothetical protein [Clostridium tarantellae]
MKDLQLHILNISRNKYHHLINLPNVQAIGYGFKYVNEKCTYEPCIHALVSKKINKVNLSYNKLIPKNFMGVKTDVIEIGTIKAQYLTGRVRPLKGGCEILTEGFSENVIGSMGCIVSKGLLFKKYYILSNNHVLAGENKFFKGTPIRQPAHSNKTDFSDIVAELSEFIEIKFETPTELPENTVDCAIAKILYKKDISKKVAFMGEIQSIGIPKIDLKVKKTGAATNFTKGKIKTIGASTLCTFQNNKKALFVNQIITTRMSDEGDSGSVLLDNNNKVIGLLMGGTKNSVSVFNDINLVLKALKVDLL